MPRSPQPDILIRLGAKWLAKLKTTKANPNATKKQIENATNKYNHPEIKKALEEMFHGKCAYCESKISVVDYGEIEHFHPKSIYESLTFEWTNLLYSCTICNSINHKGTKFPLDVNGKPLLLDPSNDKIDPFLHLDFYWDHSTKLANIKGHDDCGNQVTQIFDLNGIIRRKELIKNRSKYIEKLLTLLIMALNTIDIEVKLQAIQMLKDSCKTSEEYSAFALVHILPHLAHHFRDPEAIALLKKVSTRSPAYAVFSRVHQLP
ncbi:MULTISPECIES: retron system putative HNH endonuclease [Nostocales]|uniref:retron system putative HNH endonuclease n=1 Tax=Nostocales TaxID=1161 RepID=UPI0028C50FB1|nr:MULTISPECIES: retron system putative HNH endonuclease [Nostocales]